jgi:hypothetical protein
MSILASLRRDELAARTLRGWFGIVWTLFLIGMLVGFWWVRDLVLVVWVYGYDAYFTDGVRVLAGKPTRFSTGELAANLPDFVTGISYFVLVVFGGTCLLILALRWIEHISGTRESA